MIIDNLFFDELSLYFQRIYDIMFFMISIPKNYYSNLSCYEEFVIRTNILGYDVSNAELYDDLFEKKYCISDVNCIRIIKDFCFFAVGDDG